MSQINIDQEKIKKVLSRGVEDVIVRDHLESQLKSGKQLRIKFGVDPTGPKIHLGRAVPLRKLKEFQDLGHKVVLIIGDFTATIGDPSDKLSKRPMLTKEDIKENMKNYESQLGKIIDLKKAEIHYNSEWLENLNARELSELAESFSIQQMLARRNFKDRLDREEEISMREMLYPLFQGYDSVVVRADIEIGGFDQLFNVKAGRVIQKYYNQAEQDIITIQMLEGTDGRKMSTSWGNVINIADEPNDMFGKIMSVKDGLISKYFLLCTDVSEEEIGSMEEDMKSGRLNPRDAKLRLGREIVGIYHGQEASKKAEEEFIKVFSQKELPAEVEEFKLQTAKINILDLMEQADLAKSRGEAKRLIEQGGVKINDEVVKNWDGELEFNGDEILQVGKRKFLKIIL